MSDLHFQVCATSEEKEAAKKFRQTHFFDCNRNSLRDPYVWTFDTPGHGHFALYDGKRMIGYAHIQYWPNHRAALRIIVVHEKERKRGVGAYLLKCCEEQLKKEGIKILHTEAAPDVVDFYRNLGYSEIPFNDPDHSPSDASDTAMGKKL